MANANRLIELSMVPELAKEVAAQINAAASGGAGITVLTDNSGGTANNTVEAVPAAVAAATDTTAASLASTNTALTAIKNDIADLTVKVNQIIDAING